jgi:hypothetical protein
MRLSASLVLVILCFCANAVNAQVVPQSRFQHEIAKMRVNDLVRTQSAGWSGEGVFVQATADSVVLKEVNGERRQIARSAIDSMWKYQRATGTGAKRGALIVGIPLALFVGFLSHEFAGETRSSRSTEALSGAAVGFVFGGFVGGSVGALIGSTTKHWRLIHAKPAAK